MKCRVKPVFPLSFVSSLSCAILLFSHIITGSMFLVFQGKGATDTLGSSASTGSEGEPLMKLGHLGNESSSSSSSWWCYCCGCWEVRGSDWVDCQSCSWFPCECPEGMHSRGGEWWHAPGVLEFLTR
jgi:hypothetical protein